MLCIKYIKKLISYYDNLLNFFIALKNLLIIIYVYINYNFKKIEIK